LTLGLTEQRLGEYSSTAKVLELVFGSTLERPERQLI
jgi:hypothetical protein